MQRTKKILAILLTLTFCLSLSSTAFAKENESSLAVEYSEKDINPRIGIAGYRNYYHSSGSYYGEYTISTDSILFPAKEATIELSQFNSSTWIIIEIYNSNNQLLSTLDVVGNGKWENRPLNSLLFKNGDTYTIRYNVFDTAGSPLFDDDGWIGIWIY